jgi:hypothetical protein
LHWEYTSCADTHASSIAAVLTAMGGVPLIAGGRLFVWCRDGHDGGFGNDDGSAEFGGMINARSDLYYPSLVCAHFVHLGGHRYMNAVGCTLARPSKLEFGISSGIKALAAAIVGVGIVAPTQAVAAPRPTAERRELTADWQPTVQIDRVAWGQLALSGCTSGGEW